MTSALPQRHNTNWLCFRHNPCPRPGVFPEDLLGAPAPHQSTHPGAEAGCDRQRHSRGAFSRSRPSGPPTRRYRKGVLERVLRARSKTPESPWGGARPTENDKTLQRTFLGRPRPHNIWLFQTQLV